MTPHNKANKEDIAKTVLMPGDPLRAKYIAENFLEDAKLVNEVRGMFAYTGKYKGKEVTVMGHGMGNPSIGIYAYELFKFYDVDNIIRIGSCGGYVKDLALKEVILVQNAYSESTFAEVFNGCKDHLIPSNPEICKIIEETAKERNINFRKGNVHATDVFYSQTADINELYEKYGCIAAEMESFALFHLANSLGKRAGCILSVTDSLVNDGELSPDERQTSLNDMITLALESTLKM